MDFEDYISAHLLLGGYTLDRSIRERVSGAGDLFEVDIVTHQYKDKDVKRLVEIKSKGWDLHDVFKVGGQLRYLGVDSGAFIVQQKVDEKKFGLWQKSMNKMEVALVYVGKKVPGDDRLDLTALYDTFAIDSGVIDESMIESIRFSFIAERCMRAKVSQLNKSEKREGLIRLWEFSNAIQDISFYDEDPVQRLHKTFDLYKEYYHFSARLDYEYLHGSFPMPDSVILFEKGRIKDYLLCKNAYLPVNYSMYLEHRLRMYIIQSCVEYLVMPKACQNEYHRFLRTQVFPSLTNNILNGVKYLSEECPHYKLYPRLWQLFTYMMGGFILTDYYDDEMKLLSSLSGVPVNEIDKCFSIYDVLFPTSSAWLRDIRSTHIKRLNFMPTPLMGIGANFRRYFYRDDKEEKEPPFEGLKEKVSNDYTYRNLALWDQSAFELLMNSSDLKKC